MVKIQVNSLGKAYYTSGGKVLLASSGGGGDAIQAINNTGAAISSGDKVFIAPLSTPQSGANYELIKPKTTDSIGLGFYTVGEQGYSIPTINLSDKTAYGFGPYEYLQIPKVFDYSSPWEFNICLETGSSVSGEQYIYFGSTTTFGDFGLMLQTYEDKFYIDLYNNNNSGRITTFHSYSISANTTYYVRIGWTGTEYYAMYSTDGSTWISDTPVTSSVQVYQNCPAMRIGSRTNNDGYFKGSVFLDKTYFISNGELVWQAMYDGTWTNIGDDVVTGIATESIASGSVGEVTTLLGE